MFLGNICQACLMLFIIAKLNEFYVILSLTTLPVQVMTRVLGEFMLSVILYGLTRAINGFASEKLISHFNQLLHTDYISRWMDTKAYHGMHFIKDRKVNNRSEEHT